MFSLASAEDLPPTERSYWVVQHRLLAGSYPGGMDQVSHQKRLEKLFQIGVRAIVNLMEPNEVNNHGDPFRPYLPIQENLASNSNESIRFHLLPIRDVDIPSKQRMFEILDTIDESLNQKLLTYVHCFGGIGRTATVVGCWLIWHKLATPENVMSVIGGLRQADVQRRHRTAPETQEQREFVLNWTDDGTAGAATALSL